VKRSLAILFFLVFSSDVWALWDGSVTGKVEEISITRGENYGFRVSLKGKPKLCGTDYWWAYINESDSNYQTYVAALLSAKAAQFDVRIYTNRDDNSGDGKCKIGFITVN
jgi:hypothetical protein